MHRKTPKPLIILFVLIPFLLVSSSNAIPAEKKFAPQWQAMTKITGNTLRGVWGSIKKGEINIFAVGDKGTIIHYDGNTELKWAEMKSGTDVNLHGVWGSIKKGEINIFAVGDKGTIRRYDGNTELKWAEMKSGTEESLHGIWGTSRNDIYTVSEIGTIRHYDIKKISLSQTKIRTGVNLNAICGSVQKDEISVFAVGDGGTIIPYDDKREVMPEGMKSRTDVNLNGIWASDDGDFFAVGDGGTIRHYIAEENKGKKWVEREWVKKESPTPANLHSIWGTSGKNIYAVGDSGTVIHYDGDNWSMQEPKPTTVHLYGVWVSANPHVYVVGEGGFTGGKAWAAIWGWICDSCTGAGILNAQVQRRNSSNDPYLTWCNGTTNSIGLYDCTSCALNPAITHQFRFFHNNYLEEPKIIDVTTGTWIESYTYLLPNAQAAYEWCISGVISEIITQGGKTFAQVLNDVPVKLYKKSCNTWVLVSTVNGTSNGGHYKFIYNQVAGTYKIVPDQSPYTFVEEYNNIEFTMPQPYPPQSFDFRRQ